MSRPTTVSPQPEATPPSRKYGIVSWVPTCRGRRRDRPEADELLTEAAGRVGGNTGAGPNDAYITATPGVLENAVLTTTMEEFKTLDVPVEIY